jgi:t-SNARE complex subunit (syntaxin)
MDILAAIKREERKLEKQSHKLQHHLNGLRGAAKALGDSTGKEIKAVKKRVLSAAGRAAIIKAAKKRWSKVKKQAKKVTG